MKAPSGARVALAAAALTVLAVVGYRWAWRMYRFLSMPVPEDRCRGHERFDPAVWQDTVQVYSALAPRGCMIDDLLARHPLGGQERAAVVRLLGEPQPTSYFREFDLVYWLGPERGLMSIDSEWLVLKLDRAGRVMDARLVTD